ASTAAVPPRCLRRSFVVTEFGSGWRRKREEEEEEEEEKRKISHRAELHVEQKSGGRVEAEVVSSCQKHKLRPTHG
ncbi:unnamed protein product, partial [Pleuronectes platessa]